MASRIEQGATSRKLLKKFNFRVNRKCSYLHHINSIRTELSIRNRNRYGIPVLPEEFTVPNYPNDSFEVHCTAGKTNGIDLLFRRDNLYLVGFRHKKPNSYYEFSDSAVIPNSIKLDYGGNYFDLSSLQNLNFNDKSIISAVNVLRNYGPGNNDRKAQKCLATLIVAKSESVRFENVKNFIFKQLNNSNCKNLGSENLVRTMHSWAEKSRRILDRDDPLDMEELSEIKKVLKMAKGIRSSMLRGCYKFENDSPLHAPRNKHH